ncbi:MAG: cytochrome c peroxidase [Flavobacteriaceae bacterium]
MKKKGVGISIILVTFFSCLLVKKGSFKKEEFLFPRMNFEESNQHSQVREELGKKIFFDPILSIDSSMSCASCHKPNFAFSDTVKFSPGVFGRAGIRNTPSLMNIGYHPYFLREGSVPTIEMQALIPIQEKNEFAHNIVDIANQIKDDVEYTKLSQLAYDRELDHYVITRALGVFQRTLISNNSKFDKYIAGKIKLSKQEKKGMDIFFGKGNCSTCHGGYNFTSYKLTNNGLYEKYEDIGRMRATKDSNDLAVFKTPSLRNVSITYPYMHDGSINSLSEVIFHYNEGGEAHKNKDALIEPLSLTKSEMNNLELFLNCLTDEKYINPLQND